MKKRRFVFLVIWIFGGSIDGVTQTISTQPVVSDPLVISGAQAEVEVVGAIVGSLNLATGVPKERDTLTVEVVVDLSKVSDKLGAYKATLMWDTDVLSLIEVQDGSTSVFGGPQTREDIGVLAFSQFSAQGVGGVVSLLNAQFLVVGYGGDVSSLILTFDELAAAVSFVNLLPELQIMETSISVTEAAGVLPEGASGPIAVDLDLASGDQEKRQTQIRPKVGDEVAVDIVAVSGAQGAVGFQVVLRYDPVQLEWVRFQAKDLFVSAVVLSPALENGTVTINAAILGGRTLNDAGSLGEATFRVLSGFSGETRVRLLFASYDAPVSVGMGGAFVVIGNSLAPSPDFNGNGIVDFPDFLRFAAGFGKREGDVGFDPVLDLDQSGDVGFSDFIQFAQSFGT